MVYNPYMSALGGGERYAMAFARALTSRFQVDVACPTVPEEQDLERLGIESGGPIRRLGLREFTPASRDYDLTFQISNYRPMDSRAQRSLVLVQFPHGPFHWKHPIRFRPRPWRRDEVYITYSEFCRSWCGPRWGVEAMVVPPPVELGPGVLEAGTKQPVILAVGRFFRGRHDKRFDVLVGAYAGLPADVREKWGLVLVGGTRDRNADEVLRDLRARSRGLNVRLVTDARRTELRGLFRGATLFWQATGFGRPPDRPEFAEHFGIAMVEAMSYGCLPLAYRDGGAPEILRPLGDGCLWASVEELRRLSLEAIEDESSRGRRAAAVAEAAVPYSYAAFETRVADLLKERFGLC